MVNIDNIEKAALRLRQAEENKKTCAPVRDLIGIEDLDAAYAVQKLNSDLRVASGAKIIGHKIGLTAPVIQKQLGVDQPDFGLLWNDKEVLNEREISISEMMQAKVESEIAFVLGQDLDSELLSSVDILNAIEYALASIEIVGSRIDNWDIKITDTIADNASASHWVIGHRPVKIHELDLVHCKMKMTNMDKIVSEGKGSACLGSPINAVRWLATKMYKMGSPLKSGDLILSGALGPMVSVKAGDKFEASIDGLGTVGVSFTE